MHSPINYKLETKSTIPKDQEWHNNPRFFKNKVKFSNILNFCRFNRISKKTANMILYYYD